MYFDRIVLQKHIKDFFARTLENDRLAHAYLFFGPEGSGKDAFALELAKALNCSDMFGKPCDQCPSCSKIKRLAHPDVKMLFPISRTERDNEGKLLPLMKEKAANPYRQPAVAGHLSIAIEQIRELKSEAKYAPFEAQKRVFIVSGAEYMTREAANSFLKLLEEPPKDLLLILCTNDMQALMDTIRSRCQPVRFSPFDDQQIRDIVERYAEVEQRALDAAIRVSRHNLRRIFDRLDSNAEDYRPLAVEFLRHLTSGNWVGANDIIDALGQGRDKNKVLEFIEMAILWLRDALYYHASGSNTELLNNDMEESIIKFADFFKELDYERTLELLEKAYRDINANTHPALTLTRLAVDIQRELKSARETA